MPFSSILLNKRELWMRLKCVELTSSEARGGHKKSKWKFLISGQYLNFLFVHFSFSWNIKEQRKLKTVRKIRRDQVYRWEEKILKCFSSQFIKNYLFKSREAIFSSLAHRSIKIERKLAKMCQEVKLCTEVALLTFSMPFWRPWELIEVFQSKLRKFRKVSEP